MSISRVLVLAALVSALVAVVLGFGWLEVDGDPHLVGWLGLALGFYFTADLVE